MTIGEFGISFSRNISSLLFLSERVPVKTVECGFDFIPDPPEFREHLIFGPSCFCRIVKSKMKPVFDCADERRTSLSSMITDSYDVIERIIDELIDVLGSITADVNADFLHHFDGERVNQKCGSRTR